MKFIVYVLEDKNSCIRYVGSGTKRRVNDVEHKSRSEEFKNIFRDGGKLYVIETFETRQEATDYENAFLEKHLGEVSEAVNLINKKKTTNARFIEPEYLKQKLIYDETSPTNLRWNFDLVKSNGRLCSKARKGYVAGTKTSILIDGKTYGIHRIIWILVTGGSIPENMIINHIDGNPENNLISNLEVCSQKDNICKIVNFKSTNTGIRGISIADNHGKPEQIVRATMTNLDGKQVNKTFSITKYGKEKAIELATVWRKQQLESLYPDFYEAML